MTRLVLGLAVLWGVAAQAEPWGIVRGGGGQATVLSRTDETGAALLGDADLPADAEEVVFTRPVGVASVSLSGRTLVFSAEGGATLTCVPGAKPAFELSDGDWTFRGLALVGGGVGLHAPQFGGAIFVRGGSLALEGCSFLGFVARQTGGAVAAVLMEGDVTVTDCTFEANFAGLFNGDGGAVYASAAERGGATLRILGSVFAGNEADNGGAVFTLPGSIYDEEEPIRVEIGAGTVLEENIATYSGGALLAGGDAVVTGPGTFFTGNGAGSDGGAVCLTGIGGSADSSALVVSNGVWFTDNRAVHPNTWTSGGAVAVVAAAESRFERVGFTGNAARTESGAWSYGGAVACSGGTAAFDTCVFDCAAAGSDACSGNAIDLDGTASSLGNCTFRRGVLEAVSVAGAAVAITNCVLVGNALAGGAAGDLRLGSDASVSLAFCAYGVVEREAGASLAEEKCLAGRTADIYAGDSLELDPGLNGGFNPVAVLGLVQPGVTDFRGVGYGTRPTGYSMGAFACPAMLPVLTVGGDRRYDGTETSDGITNYVWTLTSTNGTPWTCPELGPITNQLVVTNWAFGGKDAGDYCSTNDAPAGIVFGIAANPGLPAAEQERINRLTGCFLPVAAGTVERRPVVFRSEGAEKVYDTLPLTRHEASDASLGTLDEPCGLVPGETVTFAFTGSQAEVGSSSNWFEAVWATAEAPNYDLRPYVCGTLTVTPRPADGITVLPVPDSAYGGTNITPRVTAVITNAAGEVISNLVEGVDFEVAYEDNLNVFDSPYLVVMPSTNFTGTVTNAFRILPRPVTFVSASAEKEYDGTPLRANEVTWTRQDGDGPGTGVVATEERHLGFDVTGSQTEVGVSSNWYEVAWNEGIDIRNYAPTYEYGTLTVWQKLFPEFEIVSTEWYHNRGDGLYYPRIVIRFIGGNAARLSGLALTCEGGRYALPESCVAELRTAKLPGQEFVFGVDPDKFPASYGRTERDGYIIWRSAEERERAMLFGSYQALRPLTLELKVDATPEYDDPAAAVRSARAAEPAEVAASAAPRLVQGVAFSRALTDAPAPRITASGLPPGLRVVATAAGEKAGKRTATAGYTCVLSGTPTKAGTYRAKFRQKIGGETVVTEETFRVEPLPLWAYGTFTGWSAGDAVEFSDVGVASLKVTSAGKISGRFAVGGTTWSFSAKAYAAAPEDDGGAFIAEVEAKSGKSVRKMRLAVSPDCFRSCSYAGLEGDGVAAGLRRSVWKDKPRAWTVGKAKFTLAPLGLADVSVSVSVSGTVRFSGKLPDGTRVSSSTTAYVAEDGSPYADLIVPARKGFAGWMTDVSLEEGAR